MQKYFLHMQKITYCIYAKNTPYRGIFAYLHIGSKCAKKKTMQNEVKIVSARTPKRIAAAKRYRDAVRHKDEMTKRAVDRIVHHFVCPDEKEEPCTK